MTGKYTKTLGTIAASHHNKVNSIIVPLTELTVAIIGNYLKVIDTICISTTSPFLFIIHKPNYLKLLNFTGSLG